MSRATSTSFRRLGKDVKPYESFELANGKIDSRQLIDKSVKAGENYAIQRGTATIVKFWDVINFPFDRKPGKYKKKK